MVQATVPSLSRSTGRWRRELPMLAIRHGMVVVFVLLVVISVVSDPNFLAISNIWNLTLQWAPVGLMAVGMTYVILAGGFDLSVGGMYAAGAVLFAGLANSVGSGLALIITLAAGAAVGLVNGLIVTKLQVNPFVTTLGTGFVLRGVALVTTNATPIIVTAGGFDALGSGAYLGVPTPVILLLIALVVGGLALKFTVLRQERLRSRRRRGGSAFIGSRRQAREGRDLRNHWPGRCSSRNDSCLTPRVWTGGRGTKH